MINFKELDQDELNALAVQVAEERRRREEEDGKIVFPLVAEIDLGTSKSSMDGHASELGLPEGPCSDNFRYAFLNLTFKVRIYEDGTVFAIGFKGGKMQDFFMFPETFDMMCD